MLALLASLGCYSISQTENISSEHGICAKLCMFKIHWNGMEIRLHNSKLGYVRGSRRWQGVSSCAAVKSFPPHTHTLLSLLLWLTSRKSSKKPPSPSEIADDMWSAALLGIYIYAKLLPTRHFRCIVCLCAHLEANSWSYRFVSAHSSLVCHVTGATWQYFSYSYGCMCSRLSKAAPIVRLWSPGVS